MYLQLHTLGKLDITRPQFPGVIETYKSHIILTVIIDIMPKRISQGKVHLFINVPVFSRPFPYELS